MSSCTKTGLARSQSPPFTFQKNDPLTGSFGLIPNELILKIFSYLPVKDVVKSLGETCRTMHLISQDNGLWRSFAESRFAYLNTRTGYLNAIRQSVNFKHNVENANFQLRCIARCQGQVLSLEADQNHLYFSTFSFEGSTIKVLDRTNEELIQTFTGHQGTVSCLRVYKGLLFSGSTDCTIKIWRVIPQMTQKSSFRLRESSCSSAITNRADITRQSHVSLSKGASTCLDTIKVHQKEVTCIRIDDDYIYSGSADRTIRVWSRVLEECIHTLYGHEEKVSCIEIDDQWIYSGAADHKIKIWNKITGICQLTLVGHCGIISSLHVEGHILYTSAEDTTFNLWNLREKQRIETFLTTPTCITHLQFIENYIVAATNDGKIAMRRKNGNLILNIRMKQKKISGLQCVGNIVYLSFRDGMVIALDFSIPPERKPPSPPPQNGSFCSVQ